MMTSVKISTIFCAAAASSRRFSATIAAEGRDRIAGERLLVGLEQRRADRDAAGVGVLDDRDRGALGRIEFGHELIGRVGVVDVVVGQLLALDLPRGRDAGARLGGQVERRVLMRIFAVAQRAEALVQHAAEGAPFRRASRAISSASQLEIAAS